MEREREIPGTGTGTGTGTGSLGDVTFYAHAYFVLISS